MIFEEIVQIQYSVLEEDIIFAVLFALDYPLMKGFFFHFFSKIEEGQIKKQNIDLSTISNCLVLN